MDVVRFLSMSCVFAILGTATCSSDVHERLDLLQNDLDILSGKFENDKAAIINNQKREILHLKRELDSSTDEKVTKALDKILSTGEYRDIIKSKVDEEVTHLRRSHHEMRHGFQKMRRTLDLIQEENRMLKKAHQKEPRCQCKPVEVSPTTTPKPRLTTSAQEERNNILVTPLDHSSQYQPRIVNIKTNTLSTYPYINLRNVYSVFYVKTINSLYISLYNPNKIIASTLNRSSIKIIRYKVLTYGMAEDQRTSTIFLTTVSPKTISKMTYEGNHFKTVVSLLGYGGVPKTIALDTNTQIIYACNYHHLLSVKYDGSGLTILDTGRQIYAVTLDIISGVLYYGKYKTLMKLSLSTKASKEVTRFTDTIGNLVYSGDVVYYMSMFSGTLGSVDFGRNNVVNVLQTEPVSGVSRYTICWIP